MKGLLIFICCLYNQVAGAQVNKGMPDITDVVKDFFSNYSWVHTGETYLIWPIIGLYPWIVL